MNTTALRPLGVGEILDVAIKAFMRNARTLVTIGAIVGVPFQLLSGVVQLSTVSSADQVSGSFAGASGMATPDFSRARIAGLVVTTLIGLLVSLLLTAATLKAVSDAYLGATPSVRDSLRFALGRLRSLIWLYLLLGLGVTIAFLALFIPGIWLYVAWSVATPVLLLEDLRGTAALRRSFRLVRGRWWPTAAVQVVSAFIIGIAGAVLGGLLLAIPSLIGSSSILLAVIASTIAGAVAGTLIHPLQGAITTVLYFDLRVRREGFDLALLAAGLGLPEAEFRSFALPEGHFAPVDLARLDPDDEPPPFWPPPPGWKPVRRMPAEPAERAVEKTSPPPHPGFEPPPYWPPPPGWKPVPRRPTEAAERLADGAVPPPAELEPPAPGDPPGW